MRQHAVGYFLYHANHANWPSTLKVDTPIGFYPARDAINSVDNAIECRIDVITGGIERFIDSLLRSGMVMRVHLGKKLSDLHGPSRFNAPQLVCSVVPNECVGWYVPVECPQSRRSF